MLPDQVLVRVQYDAADALQDQQPQQPPPARNTTGLSLFGGEAWCGGCAEYSAAQQG